MPLPECFVPNTLTGALLTRVNAGYSVPEAEAGELVQVGLLKAHNASTGLSGYALTDDGEEALRRYFAVGMPD